MKVRLQVLSLEHSAVTVVQFTEFRSAILCNGICKNISYFFSCTLIIIIILILKHAESHLVEIWSVAWREEQRLRRVEIFGAEGDEVTRIERRISTRRAARFYSLPRLLLNQLKGNEMDGECGVNGSL